ncbi:MAG: trigger factor [Deltaproteobacteria bacterium]|nr:MAG: trigger factor [Deltaproteobacteria bacterium]
MNVRIEEVSSISKKLHFEVAAERVDQEIERAFRKIGKTAKIKGFRPGKIPQSVLEQYYGGQMEQEVLGRLINDTYFKALDEHAIPAVGEPRIVDSSGVMRGQAFTYQAEIEVKPAVTVKDYAGIVLQKEKFELDPKVIDGRLQELQTSRAQLDVSSREQAQSGDSVVIDFEGFVDGQPFDGGKAEDFTLELGSGALIPGFEEQVAGMTRGEAKDVQVVFPEDYGQKTLAGKPAVFRVVLKEIKEKVVPALDDDLAKGFGVETLAELREQLESSFVAQERNRIDNDLRERLVRELIARNPFEVPAAMTAKQLEYMYANISNRMRSQGLAPEMLGLNPQTFAERYRETAVNQVRGTLLLEAVGKQEGITVEAGEVDGRLEEIARMANAPLEMVQKYYAGEEAREGLMVQIAEEKVVRFLLDKALVTEVPRAALEEGQASS